MTLRIYLRRSRSDGEHQAFSLDVQREGCRGFVINDLPRLGAEVGWPGEEYVDDDRAGDDFLGRTGLRRLIDESRRGDVVVCRDQSRLGRDALETTLVIRDLVRDRGARLFYYSTRQEQPFANALDGAAVFIQGTGHQMELEAIRSRTREGLRALVRQGRVAGGRCFGYRLTRTRDGAGREFTEAIVDEEQGAVVRRLFDEFISGVGLKRLAIALNTERVPPPTAGRRGTGSWAPSSIRSLLLNERYRGVYIHGRVNRRRRSGKRIAERAAPGDIMRVEVPAWRIIDDETWNAAQARFRRVGQRTPRPGPGTKYALSGIARCGTCGGAIGVSRTKRAGGVRVPAYTCQWHHERGAAVCPVTIHQEVDQVEHALVAHLQAVIFSGNALDIVLDEIREEVRRRLESPRPDTALLEEALVEVSRGLIRLVQLARATGEDDGIAEIAAEMNVLQQRRRSLEADLAVARQAPAEISAWASQLESSARDHLHRLGEVLRLDPGGSRQVFEALFPDGLTFLPETTGTRSTWRIVGSAKVSGSRLLSDPTGT